jgi:hypothetical protein
VNEFSPLNSLYDTCKDNHIDLIGGRMTETQQ